MPRVSPAASVAAMSTESPVLFLLGASGLVVAGLVALGSGPAEAAPTPPAAKTQVHTRASAPLFAGPKGPVIGSVPPGTPLERLGRSGRRVEVALGAWSRAHQPLRLVSDPTALTPRAELVQIPDGARTVAKEAVDRYESRWEKVRLTAWVPARALVDDVKEVWTAARDLQRERCTVCHGFYEANRLSASQWRGTLVIMAHRAALTPEEHALLSHYLQANARASTVN